MIYLGGAWPDEYRDQIFMNNIHGQRLNMDILKPQGSGFVGSHGPDFLLTGDLASQMLNFRYGPDGQVYVIDWYDMQRLPPPQRRRPRPHERPHLQDQLRRRRSERSRSISKKLSDLELAELVLDKNDWYVRHARRILQERAAAGKLDEAARRTAERNRDRRIPTKRAGCGQCGRCT